jgi:hypothetical protein
VSHPSVRYWWTLAYVAVVVTLLLALALVGVL